MADGDGGNRREADPVPYDLIAGALRQGKVVPFLGAGASAAHRPPGVDWTPGAEFCPRGDELARYLAATGRFPDKKGVDDLMLVASYFEAEPGDRPKLRQKLDEIFCAQELQPGPIHRLIAACTKLRLVMTTNYDSLIEQAMLDAGTNPHVVVDYGVDEWFKVRFSDEKRFSSRMKSEFMDLLDDAPPGPIVFKLHGAAFEDGYKEDERAPEQRRFVLTADDYVRVLQTQADPLPAPLNLYSEQSGFLFVGYGLGDWNVRVLLSRLALTQRSWAIQFQPLEAERTIWRDKRVNLYHCDIAEFVANVRHELGLPELPA